MSVEKTGPELLVEIAQYPTLDDILSHAPPYTHEELVRVVGIQRADRALFNIKEQKARDRKAGVTDDGEGTEPTESPAE